MEDCMSKSNDHEQTLNDQTIADDIASDDVEVTENTGSDMGGDNVSEKDEVTTDSEDGTPSVEEATNSNDVSDDTVEKSIDSAEEADQDDMGNEENDSQDNPDAINENAANDVDVASSDGSDSDSESPSDADADVNAESAGDDESSDENGTDHKSKSVFKKPTRIAILACIAGLALGGVSGYYLIPHIQVGELAGKSSLTTSEFDKVIATYNFKGHSYTITAAEVADYAGTDYGQDDNANANSNNAETNENKNGSKDENTYYDIPATEDVIAAIRDKILTKEMDDKGIKASEKQIKKYAKDNYGSDDFDSLASQYGVDKKVVKSSITRSVRIRQLYKQITGGDTPDSPNAPTSPSDSDYSKKTEDYGSYLMSIIKGDYDSDKNEWKNKKSDYYDALKGDDFDGKTASYSTCVKAYKIAYAKYEEQYDSQSQKWEDYTNELYANTDVHFTNIMPSRSSN